MRRVRREERRGEGGKGRKQVSKARRTRREVEENVQGDGVVLNEADIESVSSVELDIGT